MEINEIHENQNEINYIGTNNNNDDVNSFISDFFVPSSLSEKNENKNEDNKTTNKMINNHQNNDEIHKQDQNAYAIIEYKDLDDHTFFVNERMEKRKENSSKGIIEKADLEKDGIERRLDDSDKTLSKLIQIGTELVTNVKVANEKREVARRNFEAAKREELLQDLQNESLEAMKKFETITSKWFELEGIKEPMGLYEELQLQKERIGDLMKQKDNIIKQCQDEIKRANKTYYDDLQRQNSDIYSLVERIDNQIELIKKAYNDHIELLQKTIEIERKNMSENTNKNWEELYNKWLNNEQIKMDNEILKENLFKNELENTILEHEEMIRSTRIRLEKEAEQLQLELRSTKNNIFLNTEKLDYNYQILKKRESENSIIYSKQKKRLNQLNCSITELNKKIENKKLQTDNEIKRLTKDILQLRKNIDDLQMKTDRFSLSDKKKYEAVWKINDQEAKDLIKKILNIDKILYEEYLGLDWVPPAQDLYPSLDIIKLSDENNVVSNNSITNDKNESDLMMETLQKQNNNDHNENDQNKINDKKLLRKILNKIADHAGFLIEDKLHEILKPYTEKEKTLIKIDEIFMALGIRKIDDIELLKEYFLPYAYCSYCSSSKFSKHMIREEIQNDTFKNYDDIVENQQIKEEINDNFTNEQCPNHNLVIEYTLVLTALKNFVEDQSKFGTSNDRQGLSVNDKTQNNGKLINILFRMNKNDIQNYWSKYEMIFPEEKQKLWKFLEYGLNNYLKILKEREKLNSECIQLKKQNIELQHLLKKYIPIEMNQRNTTSA